MQLGCSDRVSKYVHMCVHALLCGAALPLLPPALAAAATSDEGKPALCPHHAVHHFSSWEPVTRTEGVRVIGPEGWLGLPGALVGVGTVPWRWGRAISAHLPQ